MNEKQKSRSLLRISFSILNLILITAIVGLSIAWYNARKEVDKLQPMVDKLIKQAYPLEIIDDTKVNIRAVPTGSEMTWKYRIFVPKGIEVPIYFNSQILSKDTTPGIEIATKFPQGEESLLTIFVRENPLESKPGRSRYTAYINVGVDENTPLEVRRFQVNADSFDLLGIEYEAFVNGIAGTNSALLVAGKKKTECYELNSRISLLQHQRFAESVSSDLQTDSHFAEGFSFWTVPVKAGSVRRSGMTIRESGVTISGQRIGP